MAQITYFAVQPFEKTDRGGYRILQPVPAQNGLQARRLAERLAVKGGAVAFSRTGDPEAGEWADALILAVYGEVPAEFMAAAA